MSSYTPEQQRDQEQVTGTLVQIVQKQGGKFQAQVIPDGSQSTRNVWIGTDKVDFLPYLSSQIGNRLVFLCNLSHWSRDGQQVTSLWLDQVGPPVAGSPALAGPQPQAPAPQTATMVHPPQVAGQQVVVQPQVEQVVAQAPMQAATPQNSRFLAEREYERPFIHRQAASKVAATLLGYLPEGERTLSTLLVLSERLVAYYNNGLPQAETLDDLMNRAMPSSMPDDGAQYDDPAAQGDIYGETPPF